MTDRKLRFWRQCKDDFECFAKHCLKIRVNKTDGTGWDFIPFILNAEQKDLHVRIMADLAAGKPVRYLIAKGRKLGFSTYIQGLAFWLGTFRKGWMSAVVAHQATATTKIAQISVDFVDMMPAHIRDEIGCKTVRGGVIWKSNKSSLELYTARSTEAPRGSSPGLIHISEAGLFDVGRASTTAEDVLQSFMGTQSYTHNTICIIESTAKGSDNCFHERWENAQKPGSIWVPIFAPWHEASTPHEIPAPDDPMLQELLDNAEDDAAKEAVYHTICPVQELTQRAREHNITPAQCRWMNAQLDMYGQQVEKFLQEHPFTARDAFISGGAHAVPEKTIQAIDVEPTVKTSGPLCLPEDYTYTSDGWPKVTLSEIDSRGSDWYFYSPIPSTIMQDQYVLGVDVSGGTGRDNAAIYVYDRVTNKQAAMYYTNEATPEKLAEQVWAASLLFGASRHDHITRMAHVVPEINNHGHVVVATLVRNRHDNLYRRRIAPDATNADERQWGYETNARTRPVLLSRFLEEVNKRPADLVRAFCLRSELSTFIRDKKGKLDHSPGKCSDAIVAAALALHGDTRLPPPSKPNAFSAYTDFDHQVNMFQSGNGNSTTYFPDN